jgi:hypothetical protein
MGLIAAANPATATAISAGMTAYLKGFRANSTPSSAQATSATPQPDLGEGEGVER